MNLAMTDQELVLSAMRQVGLIIAEHLELGMTDADEAITQLVAVLDTTELAEAIQPVRARVWASGREVTF